MAEGIERGHARTDEEGVVVGNRVKLPKGAQPPIRVYINGIQQTAGEDYELEPGAVRFVEPIVKEGKIGPFRWLVMWIGLVGSYKKHETVDVEYRLEGKTHLASDLEVVA